MLLIYIYIHSYKCCVTSYICLVRMACHKYNRVGSPGGWRALTGTHTHTHNRVKGDNKHICKYICTSWHIYAVWFHVQTEKSIYMVVWLCCVLLLTHTVLYCWCVWLYLICFALLDDYVFLCLSLSDWFEFAIKREPIHHAVLTFAFPLVLCFVWWSHMALCSKFIHTLSCFLHLCYECTHKITIVIFCLF